MDGQDAKMAFMDVKPATPNGQSVILFHGKNFTGFYWKDVIAFLEDYLKKENVECIVVGEPKTLMNKASDSARFIDPFVIHLGRKFPLSSLPFASAVHMEDR